MSALPALLEAAGAVIRGRRADCPECHGNQTVAYDEDKGLFCCHRYGCNFRGGCASLRRRLGVPKYSGARPRGTAKTDKTSVLERAARKAAAIWKAASPAPMDHPYLLRKQIQPHGARVVADALCLDAHDVDGTIRSLQFIAPDGAKRFLKDASPKGCMFAMQGEGSRVWITEGFATAATIREALGENTVAAFSAGNLAYVAMALRARWPQVELVIAADNDHRTPGNPGIAAAKAAARVARCRAIWPLFDDDDPGTDWNDFAHSHGTATVRRLLGEAL